MPDAQDFFTQTQKDQIIKAIAHAENETSGEIRVHIESHCKHDVLDRAAFLFEKLGIKKTADRNGVLFYLAINDRKFAIIGDSGINAVVEKNFWEDVKEMLREHFKQGDFVTGLTKGIELSGMKLKHHFPHKANDVNELSDEISFG
ncbi:MAG: TPM domain-containing protein [Bacteroidales bacterium]|nr:TPM domain-containing protein [Bacteroidales bacterium]